MVPPLLSVCKSIGSCFFAKELNDIPTRLLFIYFTGDTEMNGPETDREWQTAIEVIHEALGIRKGIPPYISEVFIDVRSFYFQHREIKKITKTRNLDGVSR